MLSGFDRLDVKLGQSIVPGEPVGVMPTWDPGPTAHRPALYVELRRDGTADQSGALVARRAVRVVMDAAIGTIRIAVRAQPYEINTGRNHDTRATS